MTESSAHSKTKSAPNSKETKDVKRSRPAIETKLPDDPRIAQHLNEGEKVHRLFKRVHKHTDNVRKEFIEFINRGSVIDLAIGVAVGGAFNTIVNSLVNDIIMPIVGLIAGGVNFNNLAIHIPNFFGANDEATISYGKFLQACLQFFIIAWVFFLIVKTMNNFHRKREDELVKIGKAIEKSEQQLASQLDVKAKKDSKSSKTQAKSKLESKLESTLKNDAKNRAAAREARAQVAAETDAKKKSDSSASKPTAKPSASLSTPDFSKFFNNKKNP